MKDIANIKGLKLDADQNESYLVVKEGSDASHITPTVADTDAPTGVTQSTGDAEQTVVVQHFGKSRVRCQGAIAKGDDIVPSEVTNGYVKAATAADGETILGKALEAGADGDIIEAMLEAGYNRTS